MIKLLAVGVWACLVTLGSSYVVASMTGGEEEVVDAEATYFAGLDYRSTGAITVPMIDKDEVRGYLVSRFVYTIDNKIVAGLAVPPDPFILDEVFRRLYGNADFDFENPEKFDIPSLTEAVRTAVNTRYGEELVREILIEQFDYVPKGETRGIGG